MGALYLSRINLCDVDATNEVFTFVTNSAVTNFRFSPDGRRIVAALYDGGLSIWDVGTRSHLATLGAPAKKGDFAFSGFTLSCSSDGKRAVSISNDGTLILWDLTSCSRLSVLIGHDWAVKDCAFSPDGSKIVSASDDRTLKVWDGKSGELKGTIAAHKSSVQKCSFSPDGRLIASTSADLTLKLWDARSLDLVYEQQLGRAMAAMQWTADGAFLVLGGQDGSLRILRLENMLLAM
jgi:WD40 repeat protein